MKLIKPVMEEAAAIPGLRRDPHAHPALGYKEERTAALIADTLSGWGIAVHRGLGGTGVVGTIRNGSAMRSIGLRADIDALPVTERNTFAHASVHAGRMHACGHDGHTAMLLAAARYLSGHRDFDGTVHLVFQPAEEGGGGARAMIRDGLFERFPMEAIFGVHNWPGLGVGQFAVRSGPVFASSNEFRVTIRGRGAHAAMPHNGIDPLPVACQMVQAFQTIISRNKHPLAGAVISVTMLHAGEATNVIAESCELQGTVRTFTVEVLDTRNILKGEEQTPRLLPRPLCRYDPGRTRALDGALYAFVLGTDPEHYDFRGIDFHMVESTDPRTMNNGGWANPPSMCPPGPSGAPARGRLSCISRLPKTTHSQLENIG